MYACICHVTKKRLMTFCCSSQNVLDKVKEYFCNIVCAVLVLAVNLIRMKRRRKGNEVYFFVWKRYKPVRELIRSHDRESFVLSNIFSLRKTFLYPCI